MPVTITQSTVTKALQDAVPGGRRYEVTDAKSRGLSLRVGPRGVYWSYRYQLDGKDQRLHLGDVGQWSIAEARGVAAKAGEMIWSRIGVPDEKWLDRIRQQAGKIEQATLTPIAATTSREVFYWTYEQAILKYLPALQGVLSQATISDYGYKLRTPELIDHFRKTPLPRIKRADMAKRIALIHGRAQTHAANCVRAVSAFWSWLERDTQIGSSGVTPGEMAALQAPPRQIYVIGPAGEEVALPRRGTYVPSMAEIGRVVAICRSGAIHPTIAAAIELTAFALQRRSTMAKARASAFSQAGEIGEGLWTIDPRDLKIKERKDGRPRPAHYVPLPRQAWAIVDRQLRAIGPDQRWLFPQIRARRKGDILSWIDENTLSHTMSYMPGVNARPHDLRRGFGTHGERLLGMLRAETKAILDHASGEVSTALITRPGARGSDVTGRHYSLHDGTHRTWPVMRAWADAVEREAVEAAKTLPPVAELKRLMRAARDRAGHDENDVPAIAAE